MVYWNSAAKFNVLEKNRIKEHANSYLILTVLAIPNCLLVCKNTNSLIPYKNVKVTLDLKPYQLHYYVICQDWANCMIRCGLFSFLTVRPCLPLAKRINVWNSNTIRDILTSPVHNIHKQAYLCGLQHAWNFSISSQSNEKFWIIRRMSRAWTLDSVCQ